MKIEICNFSFPLYCSIFAVNLVGSDSSHGNYTLMSASLELEGALSFRHLLDGTFGNDLWWTFTNLGSSTMYKVKFICTE